VLYYQLKSKKAVLTTHKIQLKPYLSNKFLKASKVSKTNKKNYKARNNFVNNNFADVIKTTTLIEINKKYNLPLSLSEKNLAADLSRLVMFLYTSDVLLVFSFSPQVDGRAIIHTDI
jgi:hypothetical protein